MSPKKAAKVIVIAPVVDTSPSTDLSRPNSPMCYDSGYHSNSPSISPVMSPDYNLDCNNNVGVGQVSSPDFTLKDTRQNRSLNPKAVEMMEAWYQDNFSHPYPSTEIVDYICKRGKVTTTQVRKWMANKRNRSCNTLSYNSTIHPKRLKRLQRDTANLRQARERHYSQSHMTKMAAHPASELLHQMAVSITPNMSSPGGSTSPFMHPAVHPMMPGAFFMPQFMPQVSFMPHHARTLSM